ncbi:acyl-CoA dehydrogenase family protein [Streptomyces canus]|uniref:acyl-CoA dehydrogenase family protein n=1 Tax=Streptomyces canus TaxID=58343 RepID=UPI0036935BFE
MANLGVGAPWGHITTTDVRVPAELSTDMSVMVKNRQLVSVKGEGAASTHFICAMSLGLADGVLEKTEAYLRERTSGGRPLAAMQAVQHKLVGVVGPPGINELCGVLSLLGVLPSTRS